MAKITTVAHAKPQAKPHPAPRRLTRHARERQLLAVAEELFTTQGYEATSIEDIARAAGVSRPIIYAHFGSLEGVLLACVERALNDYKHALAEAVQTAGPGAPGLAVERGSQVFFSLIERDPQRWALLFSTTTALSGAFAQRLADVRFAVVDLIAELVRAAAPTAPDERVYAFAHAIAGAGMQMGYWWLRHPETPRERIITYYRDFIVGGLSVLLPNHGAEPNADQ
ncbi:MAG TPA: TetR/AcrR family transcriptional regulator [Ktedonobacterales bacterium]|nr:TetR/AcrR family transcriptional regulator [Ktedonobacterales bacterium]